MGTIEEFLAKYQDERLARFEHVRSILSDFNPEGTEFDELLIALLPAEAFRDDEIQHYVKYMRKAFHRWEQKQMCEDIDDCVEWHVKRALKEGS